VISRLFTALDEMSAPITDDAADGDADADDGNNRRRAALARVTGSFAAQPQVLALMRSLRGKWFSGVCFLFVYMLMCRWLQRSRKCWCPCDHSEVSFNTIVLFVSLFVCIVIKCMSLRRYR
jgi:hypothetical protein